MSMAGGQERWVDAIGADLSAAAAFVRRRMAAFPDRAARWASDVRKWFAFTGARRSDRRHPVFPGPLRTAEILAVAGSAIVFVALFIDPFYIEEMSRGQGRTKDVFGLITRLGQSEWILYVTGGLLIAFSVLTSDRLPAKGRALWHRLVAMAYYVFTTVAFSGLLANLFKNLIGRARPPFTPKGESWLSRPFGDAYDFASFPSGHATTAGALAMALALLFPRFRVFFLLAGVWIAISRPVLGVHFPSDIVAGFAFGIGFSYFYARAFARKRLLFTFDRDGGITGRRAAPITRDTLGELFSLAAKRLSPPEAGKGGAGTGERSGDK
jgi:membrane-associated phospholipid phosphatase